jgi:hypothetical protein
MSLPVTYMVVKLRSFFSLMFNESAFINGLLEGSLVKGNNCNDNYECILFDDGSLLTCGCYRGIHDLIQVGPK